MPGPWAQRVMWALPQPHWRYRLRQLFWAGLDLILPPRCGGCGQLGHYFCAYCFTQVQFLPKPVCDHCGYPVAQTGFCSACQDRQRLHPLNGLRSVAFFDGTLRAALHRLKYRRDVTLADALAKSLQSHWQAEPLPGDLIIPVPLSSTRLRERGYNQAALLARAFAELSHLPYAPRALVKTRHTHTQVGLSAVARQANVAGAFRAKPRYVAKRHVILVDDVCTTGATLVACAEALLQAGAHSVWGYTLGRARARPPGQPLAD